MVSSDLSTVFEENMRFKDKDLLLERTTATETLLLDSRRSAGVFVLQCQSIGLGGTIPLETGGFKQLDWLRQDGNKVFISWCERSISCATCCRASRSKGLSATRNSS